MDKIWLYAYNADTESRRIFIQFGGTDDPGDLISVEVRSQAQPLLIIPGFVLQDGLTVLAYSAISDVLSISGFVNSIVQ